MLPATLPPNAAWRWNALLALPLGLCIVRLWLLPLGESLWTDETATFFVVHYGAGHPSFAVAPQVPQSIYYWLPWIAEKLAGFSEAVYRLPSVVALAGALFCIARLAARLIHPKAAWFAVFLCLSMRGFDIQSNDARPYAMGTFVAAASVWFLVRWLDSGRWRDALLFAAFAALLWRVQLVYWHFYPVFVLYALFRLVRRETPVRWRQAALAFALLGLALVPVALRALALFAHAREHVISPLPPVRLLFYAFEPGLFALCVGGAWLVARLLRWERISWPVSRSSLALTLAWWLCPPVIMFVFSWASRESLFVYRYYSLALPGAALAGTALAARFIPAPRWPAMSAALGAGVLLWVGGWSHLVPRYHGFDWRGAARTVNERVLDADTPVLCVSPYIEGRSPAWYPGYPLPAFLYSPLAVYPIRGRAYPFPFKSSPQAELYAVTLAGTTLGSSRRFLIYGSDLGVEVWRKWFERRLDRGAWADRTLGAFGKVELVEFDRVP
jgi:Dolichyl-phosphate-mannose-protein mannosyltransferase